MKGLLFLFWNFVGIRGTRLSFLHQSMHPLSSRHGFYGTNEEVVGDAVFRRECPLSAGPGESCVEQAISSLRA